MARRKAERLWRHLSRGRASGGRRRARGSRDRISEQAHATQRSEAATGRQEAGHRESDLIICRRACPVPVLHVRKTLLTQL
jgi:transposase, IS30 family